MKQTRLDCFLEEIVRDVVEGVMIDLMLMVPFVYLRDIPSSYIPIHFDEFPKTAHSHIMHTVSNKAR